MEQVNKGVVVTGAHAVAVAGLLQCAQQLRKAVVTAVQDNKERLDVLQPIVDLVQLRHEQHYFLAAWYMALS